MQKDDNPKVKPQPPKPPKTLSTTTRGTMKPSTQYGRHGGGNAEFIKSHGGTGSVPPKAKFWDSIKALFFIPTAPHSTGVGTRRNSPK